MHRLKHRKELYGTIYFVFVNRLRNFRKDFMMGTKILNCPCFNDGVCFENSLILRKCQNYDLCLIKQVLNRTKEQAVISLFEMEESEDV